MALLCPAFSIRTVSNSRSYTGEVPRARRSFSSFSFLVRQKMRERETVFSAALSPSHSLGSSPRRGPEKQGREGGLAGRGQGNGAPTGFGWIASFFRSEHTKIPTHMSDHHYNGFGQNAVLQRACVKNSTRPCPLALEPPV